jgi:hypothetical protein
MYIPKAIEQGHDSQNSTKEDNKNTMTQIHNIDRPV